MELIQDDDRLRHERKQAKKSRDKFTGISSNDFGGRMGGSMYSESFNFFCKTFLSSDNGIGWLYSSVCINCWSN